MILLNSVIVASEPQSPELTKGEQNMKFHHIALPVKNFDEVVAFYKDGLGLKEYIAFNMDGGTRGIMLELDCGGCIEIFDNGSGEKESNAHWTHFCIGTEDVDGAYNKALKLGAKSQMEPTSLVIEGTKTLPVRIAFVYGLAGEVIEFFKVE